MKNGVALDDSRPKLLIAEPKRFSQTALEKLEKWSDVTQKTIHACELRDAFCDFDVIWIRLGFSITKELISENTRCSILAVPATGLNHIDLDACASAGIQIVSLKGESEFLKDVRATAELTIGLTLALMRRIPQASRSVEDGHWERDLFPGRELYRKTAGIIGVGRLGTIVAGYFKALGMNVIGYDPYAVFPKDVAEPVSSIEKVLAKADVVSVHVTYHPGTRHLLDHKAFSHLKPGAYLINTSRGGVIDGASLLEALVSGKLAGAALDVLEDEPDISLNHPLITYARRHHNLIITPHIGGHTPESFEKTECFIAAKVRKTWNQIKGQA